MTSTATTTTTPPKPLLALHGLSMSQLPPGGVGTGTGTDTAPTTTTTTTEPALLLPFITTLLSEAVPFVDSVAPKSTTSTTSTTTPSTAWHKKSTKTYSGSTAPVDLFSRTVSTKGREEEHWFCRRSVHANLPEKGTASWEEFVAGFKENHPKTEMEFTPTVVGARRGVVWDVGGSEIEVEGEGEGEIVGQGTTKKKKEEQEKWGDIDLSLVEMKHKTPAPLNDRVFAVLQLTATLIHTQEKEFIVVSIPVTDFQTSPYAELSKEKGVQVGMYVSVERIRVLPNTGEVEWIMATASDAKGVLPMWVQTLAVPGQVCHDVDLFMVWVAGRRKGKGRDEEHPAPPPAAASGPISKTAAASGPISKTAAVADPVKEETSKSNGVQAGISQAEAPTEQNEIPQQK